MNETEAKAAAAPEIPADVTIDHGQPTMNVLMLKQAAGPMPAGHTILERGRPYTMEESRALQLIEAGAACPLCDAYGDPRPHARESAAPATALGELFNKSHGPQDRADPPALVRVRLEDPPPGAHRDISVRPTIAAMMLKAETAQRIP